MYVLCTMHLMFSEFVLPNLEDSVTLLTSKEESSPDLNLICERVRKFDHFGENSIQFSFVVFEIS